MSRKYNKTFTSLKTVVHDTSILDAQKILVNTDKTNPSERTNLISYINNSIDPLKNPQDAGLRNIVLGEVTEKTFNTNTFGAGLDNATITGFQYSFTHFIADGKLLSLAFPYTYNGSSVNEGYLFAEVCDADFNRLTSAYSENTFGFGSDGSPALFTFKNLILPKEYHVIRFALVANTEKEPDFSNGTNCLSFRARPLKISGNVNFDDDECLIFNGSSTENWVIDASVTYEVREGGLLRQYPIEINTAVNGNLTEGLTFNTNTVNGALDNASIKGIQYSKEHFINDAHITSIAIPYNYQSGGNSTGYLYIEIINEEGIVVNSGYSVESSSFNDSSSGEHTATFNFTDFYIPENYKLVRLALVTNKTTVPNIVTTENCLSFRARPVKLNNNVNYDDDDCMIYASATNTQNWVIALTATYNQIVGGVTDDILYNNIRAERLLKDVNSLTAASKTHISNEEAQNKFANKAITETTLGEIGYIYELAPDAAGEGECDAIHYAANKIPHNIVIDEIRIPTLNDSPKPLYLAVWIINQSDVKTYIGLSDSTTTWSTGGTAIWKFTNNPINVPENYRLELFLAETAPASGANQVTASTNYIKAFTDYSGGGTARYGNRWYSGRDIRTTFVKNGIVVNHEERISILEEKTPDEYPFITNEEAAETYLSKEEAAEIYLTKEGNNNNNIDTDNLAKLDEDNTFTGLDTFSQYVTFNGGMISNGDIILNGSKLLLANGAAVELYTGEELPTPEGSGGGSNPLPNTGNCSYNEVKEHVEYHLQDDWSHLSFTERIVMDNIYRADIDNHISYYNSNRIDKVSELQYTTANKIVLHTPYFLNGTLSVIQLTRDTAAAVNCKLIASFYDKDDNLLISKVSINSWDYSQTGSVANFFFNAFDVPYNSTKLVLEFTTDGSTPINDFIPIGYIVDSTTNGDTIVSPNGVMNYRVYITQFTPSPAITGLVPDTENILLDLAYGNMGNSGTNADVGNITLAGTSTIVSPVTFTPISECGWAFCIVKFNEATSDAYIALNGIKIYRGDTLIGTSPFPLNLLLSPGDTFEASEKTQIENLRVYGCK